MGSTILDIVVGLEVLQRFKDGLMKAIELLEPHTIIIYGSDNYDLFDELRERGINIIAFPSKTNLPFMKEGKS